jgi:hypothetical protein
VKRASLRSLLAAAGVALAAGVLAVGISRLETRGGGVPLLDTGEIWLLALFTGGVLALLLGSAARLGARIPGQAARRGLARRFGGGNGEGDGEGEGDPGEPGDRRFANGVMATGGWLLLVYMIGWLALG